MKWIIGAIFLLMGLASCKSRKAVELREAIVQKERVAFNILVGKNGPEERKLEHLIKRDYKAALALVDEQEKQFNQLIKEIETLPVDGIELGPELKMAAVNYYMAVRDLQLLDREAIGQQEASLHAKGEALKTLQDKGLVISRQKLDMYRKVHEKEKALHEAREKFDSANNL